MPLEELDMTDQQNSQTAPPTDQQKQEVTLELRKYILLLASLVATVTYAAGFSPPGDVWQDTAAGHLAGDPIIRDTHRKRYVAFFYCNATAFAASLVVIVITLTLAYLDDYKHKFSASKIVVQYVRRQWIAVRTLQAAMVLDLLSLMAAYAAGTCRDTFTTVYSSVLVGVVFFYLVVQMAMAARSPPAAAADLASVLGGKNPQYSSSAAIVPGSKAQVEVDVEQEQRQVLKAKDRFRKVLMLLATFAVSITYLAGLSTPGGFWDSAGTGHLPGDAILKDRHSARLAVFFVFNTLAFVASLLIVVVLLDTKLRAMNAYGFIVVALISLIGAYNAGSCRQTDTTFYVFSLIPAVLLYISFLYVIADHIHDKWQAVTNLFRKKRHGDAQAGEEPEQQPAEPTEKEKAANKARSLVLLLATLAATITYQAGLDPPGGVWQDNSAGHTAGDPILLTTNPRRYKVFFYCNSVSLVASLVAIVLAQKKLLLRHHVLEAVMVLDLFGLIGAYAAGSCRDVNTSIHAMALAGAVLVYVVIHVVFITLDDDTHTRTTTSQSDREEESELVEKTRKRLLLFAILAATITYQAGLTPPGGFLLQDGGGLQSGSGGGGHYAAGDPVLLYNFPRRYKAFFYCNSVSFMLSIALIILLVNPNVYRPAIRTHALSVCTAAGLFGLMGAFAAGSTQHLKTSVYIFVLVAVVIFFIVLLFLVFWFTGCSRTAPHQGAAPPMATNTEDKDTKKKKSIHANRKYLMLLGILVASVTYQAGLEPPGRAWQSSGGGGSGGGGWYEAGDPVMHDNRRPRYLAFFYSNSTSFMASVVVILLLLVPQEKLFDNRAWRRRWLVVMNTTIVLDLLGLLGAYAAGSSRRWKTSLYVLLLVVAVLVYMGFHLVLSCIIRKRRQCGQPLHGV